MTLSVKELWNLCYGNQKVYRAWYNKYVSKVSIYFTWLLIHTNITANQVTIISYFFVIIASIFFFTGSLWNIFIGIMIIQFTNMLDCVDGELARYRKESSLLGAHLEDIYHSLVWYLMFFPLAFGIFLKTGWEYILIFGFLCSAFSHSVIIPAMESSIIKGKLGNAKHLEGLLKKNKSNSEKERTNLKGSKVGQKLSDLYDKFSAFWAAPTNIIHVTVISIVELINMHYKFMPGYFLFYWYLAVYSVVSIMIQIVSFVVHYKGRAVEHYFRELFQK